MLSGVFGGLRSVDIGKRPVSSRNDPAIDRTGGFHRQQATSSDTAPRYMRFHYGMDEFEQLYPVESSGRFDQMNRERWRTRENHGSRAFGASQIGTVVANHRVMFEIAACFRYQMD